MNLKIFPKDSVPDIPVLGFMLDVSRGRVPTMPSLFALVDLLRALRFDQLQLYVEHTYAFKNHEAVWREASPLTSGEVLELDAYCRKNGIELVPNLNSFGHVERWLKHEKYKPLAECPDGFYHEIFKMQRVAGTFAACEETADFMGELYREYLPNFSSNKFNIGGDEPWELGQGRSRALCEKRGKRTVYLEHMMRLKKRADACGKKIMFWGDVLLGEDGEIPADFLRDTIPVIWGYDAGHPFGEQCARVCAALEKSGGNGEFYVAPGTSSWLSFGTRQTNALANIREACSAAKKYGARGVLLTTWGDFGYHNPASANLLPLIVASAEVRGGTVPETPKELAEILGNLEISDGSPAFAEALLAFGKLDDCIAKKITNRSIAREMFFAKGDAFARVMEGVSVSEVDAAKTECERVLKILENVPKSVCGNIYVEEFVVAVEMTYAALRRAEAFLKNDADALADVEAEMSGPLKEKFAVAWRRGNREGGLAESLGYF